MLFFCLSHNWRDITKKMFSMVVGLEKGVKREAGVFQTFQQTMILFVSMYMYACVCVSERKAKF